MGIKFSGLSTVNGLVKGYTPPPVADFSDALLWYDFSDESSVTLVNTDEISSVANKGTHGGAVAPLSDSVHFKYGTIAALNNLNAVNINGTAVDSLVQSDSTKLSTTNADQTYYFVINRTAVRTTLNFALTITKVNPVGSGNARWEEYSQFDNGPADYTIILNRPGITFSTADLGDFVAGVDVVCVRFGDSINTLKYSRTADATEYPFVLGAGAHITADAFYHISGAWGGNRPALGQYQMGEFVYYPTYHDDTTATETIDILKSKWGVA